MATIPGEMTAAQKVADLGLHFPDDIQWNFDTMFPKLKGMGIKREIKQKHAMIQKLHETLADTLYPDEEVQYVARGAHVKFSEQYFLGIWAHVINQTVFVLTNVRVLMFHINTRGKFHNSIWMVYYSQIMKFKKSPFFGSMVMKLKDKKKFVFSGFKGPDRKRMPKILAQMNEQYSALDFDPEVTQSRENLCTVCKQVVPRRTYKCKNCGQTYWQPSEIALRSLIFPSWGDWIMGHRGLAIAELFGYVMTWIVIIVLAFSPEIGISIAMVIGAVMLIAAHGFDAVLTRAIAQKGLTPRQPLVKFQPVSVSEKK
ncbi:MAG: hypothetical protein ACR2NP_08505 [Pirellulaceae bacterium]